MAPLTSEHRLRGIEIFPGVGVPVSRAVRYGAAFVGAERGSSTSLVLAGWVDYTPIFFKPETECTILGGRWCLIEVRDVRLRGTLYGFFGGGRVRWNEDGKLGDLAVRMQVSGGTRAYRQFSGAADLKGVLDHHPFPPAPPRVYATLRLVRDASGVREP